MSHGPFDTSATTLTCHCVKGRLQVYHEDVIIWKNIQYNLILHVVAINLFAFYSLLN